MSLRSPPHKAGAPNFMKTQFYTAASLDGFIATEDDSLDWLFQLGSPSETDYPAFIAEVGALAMGSATYEWILRHADQVAAETGSPWPYTQPTWVFSSRALPSIAGANIHFVRGDVRPIHEDMRQAAGSKNIWIVGTGPASRHSTKARCCAAWPASRLDRPISCCPTTAACTRSCAARA